MMFPFSSAPLFSFSFSSDYSSLGEEKTYSNLVFADKKSLGFAHGFCSATDIREIPFF
jgi:hypothetical protein